MKINKTTKASAVVSTETLPVPSETLDAQRVKPVETCETRRLLSLAEAADLAVAWERTRDNEAEGIEVINAKINALQALKADRNSARKNAQVEYDRYNTAIKQAVSAAGSIQSAIKKLQEQQEQIRISPIAVASLQVAIDAMREQLTTLNEQPVEIQIADGVKSRKAVNA